MQKTRKILRAVPEKTALLTNQPIITNNLADAGPKKNCKQIFFAFLNVYDPETHQIKAPNSLANPRKFIFNKLELLLVWY